EREEALVPTAEFDEAMEALSGAAHAAYRRLIEHPDLVAYFQAASPLEEIALLNIGSRPARRAEARSLADLRAIPWVFAWSQNRHFIPGWYGVGSGLQTFLEVRGGRGEALLKRMFNESRRFASSWTRWRRRSATSISASRESTPGSWRRCGCGTRSSG